MDGMSSDNTREVIKEYIQRDSRIKLIINKNRLPEGKGNGKWLGFRNAGGKIIGIIDQDNVLQDKDLFKKVISAFSKEKNILGALGGLTHDKKDSPVVRYVSLVGTDSFFAYRSIDFLRNILRKKSGNVIHLSSDNMPLTGGNCFFYLKQDLVSVGGYEQDVLAVKKLIQKGKNNLVVIPNATKHFAETSLFALAKKKFLWGRKFSKGRGEKFDYLPRTSLERKKFLKNFLFNMLILPNFFYAWKLYKKSHDNISFFFPIMAFTNTLAYGINFAGSFL